VKSCRRGIGTQSHSIPPRRCLDCRVMKPTSRLPLLIALAALALALAAAPALAAPKAYVLNYGTDSVAVLDTATNQFVGPEIEVGSGPYSIAITPDGKTAYELNESEESISVIDLRTNQVVGAPIELDTRPYVIAISPDGKTAYITTSTSEVLVLDTQTNQVVDSIPVEGLEASLWGVAFAPDGKTAYVLNEGEDGALTIDTQTRQIVGAPIPTGEDPINVAITPDGKKAYVTNYEEASVSVIDTATRQNVGTIPVGSEPWGITITPDGRKAYSANYGEGTLTAIDTQTNSAIGSPIAVGEEPYESAATPDGKTLYVTNYETEDISVVDTQTDTVKTTIEDIDGGPWQIVVAPDQSPVPAFSASQALPGGPVAFNGSASSDADGSIASFDWSFGDGAGALNGGATPTHQYATAGTYTATLAVTDNEGCSLALVFTGRTAYCSGSALTSHSVTALPKPIPSNSFRFGKVKKNRKKGIAKLQITLPGPGALTLAGKKVRFVKAKAATAGTVTLTIRAKTKANKVLKRRHRLKVHFRVKFTPTGGSPSSKGKTLTLIRKR
jgi:YVTN family beta-propeller protein